MGGGDVGLLGRIGVGDWDWDSLSYLVHDVLERVGTVDGEADEEEVGFWVREWAQSVVFFLSGCVPEGELDRLAGCVVAGLGDVVFEHGGHVFL